MIEPTTHTAPSQPKEAMENSSIPTAPAIPAIPPANYDNILIVKKDRTSQQVNVKVRRKMARGYSHNSYQKILNPLDFNDLAILFEDLDLIVGAPIEKAFRKYKQNKGGGFPFY